MQRWWNVAHKIRAWHRMFDDSIQEFLCPAKSLRVGGGLGGGSAGLGEAGTGKVQKQGAVVRRDPDAFQSERRRQRVMMAAGDVLARQIVQPEANHVPGLPWSVGQRNSIDRLVSVPCRRVIPMAVQPAEAGGPAQIAAAHRYLWRSGRQTMNPQIAAQGGIMGHQQF